jgi:hypothetical protein
MKHGSEAGPCSIGVSSVAPRRGPEADGHNSENEDHVDHLAKNNGMNRRARGENTEDGKEH